MGRNVSAWLPLRGGRLHLCAQRPSSAMWAKNQDRHGSSSYSGLLTPRRRPRH